MKAKGARVVLDQLGRNKQKIFICFLFLFSACVSPSYLSNQQKNNPATAVVEEVHPDKLSLVYFSPEETAKSENSPIILRFSQPMVKKEKVGIKTNQIPYVQVVPLHSFDSTWNDQKTLRLTPQSAYRDDTTYTVTIKAGYESLLGYAFLRDTSFSFVFKPSPVEKVSPTLVEKSLPQDVHEQTLRQKSTFQFHTTQEVDDENKNPKALSFLQQETNVNFYALAQKQKITIWLTNQENQQPLSYARVFIYDAKGNVYHQSRTSRDGIAHLPGLQDLFYLARRKFAKEKIPETFYLFAQKQNRQGYVPLKIDNNSNYTKQELFSYLQTKLKNDLIIFPVLAQKSEQELNVSGVLRKIRLNQLQLTHQPIQLFLRSVEDQKVMAQQDIQPDVLGFFQSRIEFAENLKNGVYELIFTTKNGERIGGPKIQVNIGENSQQNDELSSEKQRKIATRKIQWKLDKTEYVPGEKAKLTIEKNNEDEKILLISLDERKSYLPVSTQEQKSVFEISTYLTQSPNLKLLAVKLLKQNDQSETAIYTSEIIQIQLQTKQLFYNSAKFSVSSEKVLPGEKMNAKLLAENLRQTDKSFFLQTRTPLDCGGVSCCDVHENFSTPEQNWYWESFSNRSQSVHRFFKEQNNRKVMSLPEYKGDVLNQTWSHFGRDGKIEKTIQIPHEEGKQFLYSYIFSSNGKLGCFQKNLQAYYDVAFKAKVPNWIRVQDVFVVEFDVQPRKNSHIPLSLYFESQYLEPAGTSSHVEWKSYSKEKLQVSFKVSENFFKKNQKQQKRQLIVQDQLKVKVIHGQQNFEKIYPVQIHSQSVKKNFHETGFVFNASELKFEKNRKMLPGKGGLTLSFASTPDAIARLLVTNYEVDSRYHPFFKEFVKVYALLLFHDHLQALPVKYRPERIRRKLIEDFLIKLKSYQSSDGNFIITKTEKDLIYFSSFLDFLKKAEDLNYSVQELLTKSQAYFRFLQDSQIKDHLTDRHLPASYWQQFSDKKLKSEDFEKIILRKYNEEKKFDFLWQNQGETHLSSIRVLTEIMRSLKAPLFSSELSQKLFSEIFFQFKNEIVSPLDFIEIYKTLKFFSEQEKGPARPVYALVLFNGEEGFEVVLDSAKNFDELFVPMDKLPDQLVMTLQKEKENPLFYDAKWTQFIPLTQLSALENKLSLRRSVQKLFKKNQYQVDFYLYNPHKRSRLILKDSLLPSWSFQSLSVGGDEEYDLSAFFQEKKIGKISLSFTFKDVPRGYYHFSYVASIQQFGTFFYPPAELYDNEKLSDQAWSDSLFLEVK